MWGKGVRERERKAGVPLQDGAELCHGPDAMGRGGVVPWPMGQGACIAATGDNAFRAPPSAGPRRVKAMEVPGAVQFTEPYAGAQMRRGSLAPSVPRAGTFTLFWLPGGRPRHFGPELADPVATEEAEGSIARGGI
jgi:hypothetical protein